MVNILIFGDSITWGACDYKYGGWANRLRNYFEERGDTPLGIDGKLVDIGVYNLGISGDNTEDILARFNFEAKIRKPGMIILAVGVNDTQRVNTKDNPRINEKDFEKNYKELIGKAKKFTDKIICMGLTPVDEEKTTPIPWNPTKSYYNEFIKQYDQIIQDISRAESVEYISVYNLLDPRAFQDGLHPGTEGHEKIFKAVKQYLEN